ncbi:hypothetical protein SDC9_163496 [bioreactor metagenome]|uniref:Uncharacterized protein n=1 Tax=bioreactor metagenome TaxID=1076179 RepID=A0A645FNZ5_9ZZZZ
MPISSHGCDGRGCVGHGVGGDRGTLGDIALAHSVDRLHGEDIGRAIAKPGDRTRSGCAIGLRDDGGHVGRCIRFHQILGHSGSSIVRRCSKAQLYRCVARCRRDAARCAWYLRSVHEDSVGRYAIHERGEQIGPGRHGRAWQGC